MATEGSKKANLLLWAGWPPLLLIILGAAVYANNLDGPFVFDDHPAIIENDSIRGLWPPWRVFQAPPSSARGRPVGNLSLAINYAVGGLDVRGYHVFNIAVHVLAALVLFGIVRRTLLCEKLGSRFGRAAPGIALACALLWMVHPIQTESVNYLTQRFETIMGLFYFLTLYCAIRAAGSRRRRWWYVAAVASCALGMGTKEVMVTAPLMVLLYDRTFRFGSFRELLRRRGGLYAGLAGTWSVLVVLAAAFPHEQSAGFSSGVSPLTYAGKQCFVVTDYLKHVAWPHPLVFDYGRSEFVPGGGLWVCGGVLAALLLAAAAGMVFRPMLGFLGCWFFVALAPTSSIIPLPTEVGAERRLYVPLAGLVVLVVLGVYLLLARVGRSRARGPAGASGGAPRFAVGLGVFVAVAAAGAMIRATVRRNADYHSAVSIWRTAVQAAPYNPRAHYGIGKALQSEGRSDEAIRHLRDAIRIKGNYAYAHNVLGIALASRGEPAEGIRHLRLAIRIHPELPDAHSNLGNILVSQGKTDEAIRHYHLALRFAPRHRDARYNLGVALMRQGKPREAIGHFREALRLGPDHAETHGGLANALVSVGRTDEAIRHYRRAITIKPEYGQAHYNLGNALAAKGRFGEASGHYRQALRFGSNDAITHYNLGVTLLRIGKSREAVRHFQGAARLRANWPPPLERLAWVLATHPDASVRDGSAAVRFAEQAAALTGRRAPKVLDTLAAAYAETGQFDKAIDAAEEAIALATTRAAHGPADQIRQRLELYKRRTPYRAPG